MNTDLWVYLDPRGMGITLALSAILLAVVLLITDRAMAHRLAGLRLAAAGVICAALGVMINMLQSQVAVWIGVSLSVAFIVAGVGLILAGVMQLRDQAVPWWALGLLWVTGIAIGIVFGVIHPDVRWRIGLLSAVLCLQAAWLARVAMTEDRAPFLKGMGLLVAFGVVFATLMGIRGVAAAMGVIASSVSLSLVNAGSVIAGGLALIGAVIGLVFILAGDLIAVLEHQAQHDPLTGLLNRQGLRKWLDAQDPATMLSLAMVDLDHFKSVNDRWGHAAGDQVLVRLGHLLASARTTQVAEGVRLGGEEFLLLLVGANPSDTLESIIERLRIAFERHSQAPQVTFSAGVAQGGVAAFENTLRRADAALYRAKNGGRNQVVCDSASAFTTDLGSPEVQTTI